MEAEFSQSPVCAGGDSKWGFTVGVVKQVLPLQVPPTYFHSENKSPQEFSQRRLEVAKINLKVHTLRADLRSFHCGVICQVIVLFRLGQMPYQANSPRKRVVVLMA